MANAAGNNPLHWFYNVDKTNTPAVVKLSGVRYVEAGNPLSPAFKRNGDDGMGMMTATIRFLQPTSVPKPL